MISRLVPLTDALLLVTGALLVIGLSATTPRPRGARVIAVITAAIAALASPFAVQAIMRYVWSARGELPQAVAWYPMMFAILVVLIAMALFPQSATWRVAFVGVVFIDTVLNLVNMCAPGWCGRYGFPFVYSWWSDAIAEINGKIVNSGTSVLAVAENVLVLLGCGIVMSLFARRRGVVALDNAHAGMHPRGD